jgi:hypothetical protein
VSIPILEILPGIGIGPIHFGMGVKQVVQELKQIGLTGNGTYFGADNAVQVEYTDKKVSFIGLAHSPAFQATLFGMDVFDTGAEEIFAKVAARESQPHTFDRGEYVFPDSIVTLWEADEQYDPKGLGRQMWGQVGLGNDVYLEGIRALE